MANVIEQARQAILEEKRSRKWRAELNELLESWHIANQLSNGKLEDRNTVWAKKRRKIEAMIADHLRD